MLPWQLQMPLMSLFHTLGLSRFSKKRQPIALLDSPLEHGSYWNVGLDYLTGTWDWNMGLTTFLEPPVLIEVGQLMAPLIVQATVPLVKAHTSNSADGQ